MQTGRYPHQHGVEYMDDVIDDTPGLPPYESTFMERLQCAGYYTAAYGKIHMMPERGFHEMQVCGGKGARWTQSAGQAIGLGTLGRDYAAWLEERHPGGYEAIFAQRRQPEYRQYHTAISNVLPLEEYVDYWLAQNTIDFIRRDHERPFFVQCGFCGPHAPEDPPSPYDALFRDLDEVPLPVDYGWDENRAPRATTPEEDRIARTWWAYYWGLVKLIDEMVGRIVQALEEKNLLDNTLILFTSDHAHPQGKVFYEETIRVPLIVVPPASATLGKRIDGLVETYDVGPTILDYARAEIPANTSASSLRPLVEGRGSGKRVVLCEYLTEDRSARGICLRSARYKYIYWSSGDPERFYDLQEDPLEQRNLIGDPRYSGEIARHRVMLIDRLMNTPH